MSLDSYVDEIYPVITFTHPCVFQTIMTLCCWTQNMFWRIFMLISHKIKRKLSGIIERHKWQKSYFHFCIFLRMCVCVGRAQSSHHYHSDTARTAQQNSPSQPHGSDRTFSQCTWKSGVWRLQYDVFTNPVVCYFTLLLCTNASHNRCNPVVSRVSCVHNRLKELIKVISAFH